MIAHTSLLMIDTAANEMAPTEFLKNVT